MALLGLRWGFSQRLSQAAVKVRAGGEGLSSHGSAGEESASKLPCVLVGRTHSLGAVGQRPPSVLCHVGLSHMAAQLASSKYTS